MYLLDTQAVDFRQTFNKTYVRLFHLFISVIISFIIIILLINNCLIHCSWFNYNVVARQIKTKVRVENNNQFTSSKLTIVKQVNGSKIKVGQTCIVTLAKFSSDYIDQKIKIDSNLLKALKSPGLTWVSAPLCPIHFRNVIKCEVDQYLVNVKHNNRQTEFVNICQKIVNHHLVYSRASLTWQHYEPITGDFHFCLGDTKKFKEGFVSVDGISADKLITGYHEVVCRHYVDFMVIVSQEIKSIYPGQYDNLYLIPTYYPMSWHTPALAINITSPKSCQIIGLDPTFAPSETFNPTFAVLQEMYLRNIITRKNCVDLFSQYLTDDGCASAKDLMGYIALQ